MPEDIHWLKYETRFQTMPAWLPQPDIPPGMCVCIPVYAEPDLISTMESLLYCGLPDSPTEVLLLFNKDSRMTPDEMILHDQSWIAVNEWINHADHQKQGLTFIPIYISETPVRKGGVGWARKMAMDEAARRLEQQGVILCLDADCKVEMSYLKTVSKYFFQNSDCDAASIYFEHVLENLPDNELKAIMQYELHLRYLVHAIRWTGHPFSFHTVGSAMAVRRGSYLAQGGMNTKQAGEDFYFLQKFIEAGSFHEIKATSVYPSTRMSLRVPFGTGKAMTKLLSSKNKWPTTAFEVFLEIKSLFAEMDQLRTLMISYDIDQAKSLFLKSLQLHQAVIAFLAEVNFFEEVASIVRQTTNEINFRKRVFRYFNLFMMIRYMHFAARNFYPDTGVFQPAVALLAKLEISIPLHCNMKELLEKYRHLDRV